MEEIKFVFYMVGCDYGYHFFEDMMPEEEYGLGFTDGFGFGYDYGTGFFGDNDGTDGNYINHHHTKHNRETGEGYGYATITRDGLNRSKGN